MKLLKTLLLIMTLCCVNFTHAQDVWLQNYFAPNGGCNLSSNENVNVLINNNSGSFIPANSITVSYTLDGASLTSELLGVNLGSGASWNFSFAQLADLSACGAHEMKVWVEFSGDSDQTNDTLTWIVQNDCTVIPGSVSSDITVCEGANSGILNLTGWSYGTISDWEYSIDGGGTWNSIGNTSTAESYLNVSTNTIYQVQIDGGFCPDATSSTATISVQTPPVAGSVDSDMTLCESNADGMLNLNGTVGSINFWQSSIDNGASWQNIPNTTLSQAFSGLTTDTWYRAQVEGGVCPDVYATTAMISVDPTPIGGTLMSDQTICEGNTVDLSLSGQSGSISNWEYSIDQTNWFAISNTSSMLTSPVLTETTYYRAILSSGVCDDDTSSTVTITVDNNPIPGDINYTMSLCEDNGNGSLEIVGATGNVNYWESSTDAGVSWSPIPNTTTNHVFSGITTETWFRAQIEGGACLDVYVDTAVIYIDQFSVGGTVVSDQSICEGSSVNLSLTGENGAVLDWEYSTDLSSWNSTGSSSSVYSTPNLNQTTYFRAQVQNGMCPQEVSSMATVSVTNQPVGGVVDASAVHCVSDAFGTLTLSGQVGSVLDWEYSNDDGTTWNGLSNTLTTYNYSGLVDTTWFRVVIEGGDCPDTYSSIAILDILQDSDGGVLSSDFTICEGDSVDLVLGGFVGGSLEWEYSEDMTNWFPLVSGVSTQKVSPVLSTHYRVVVQNESCTPNLSNDVLVTVNPSPNTLAGVDIVMTEGDTIVLNGQGGAVGVWSPVTGLSDPNIPNPEAWPSETITYTYTAMTAEGCIESDDVLVTVEPPLRIDIKNVITSNSDGYNDTWIIDGIENFPNTEVKIFDIYGVEVYSNGDYKNDWEGTYNDKMLPNGTYFYIVKVAEEEKVYKGNITIIGHE